MNAEGKEGTMTTEMFIGGLMILTLVAGVVIAMTTSRNSDDRQYGSSYPSGKESKDRMSSKR